MKQILLLICLFLVAAPMVASAQDVRLGATEDRAVVLKVGHDDERRNRRHSEGGADRRDQNENNLRQNNWRDDRRSEDDGGARDNRINQAMAIASSRGRVLDAGPMGGSIFWVRVATDHGRVDIIVDTASGRIIGER